MANEPASEQAVLVYLDGVVLRSRTYDDLYTLEDQLIAVIEREALGEFDGNEIGEEGAVIFMYGPDAERLYAGVEATLRSCPLCEGARVVVRFGGPGASQRELAL
jgi:hypothetical protein